MTRPALIVTVDTEEEGLWSGEFRRHGNTVKNVLAVERLQALCDGFGIRPTYLVDTPVVENAEAVAIIRKTSDAGRCEVGAHLHPWCAPPFEEESTPRNTFMCNLPESLQREKLDRLTKTIEDRFGRRPTSFRAGRYGLGVRTIGILAELGYVVDSSVISFHDYSDEGGPDFRGAPYRPYRIGCESPCAIDPDGPLLEIPVSVGFNWRNCDAAHRTREFLRLRIPRSLHPVGIVDRLNLLRQITFSPEKAGGARMKQLAGVCVAIGAPCMVMILHSSSLAAGYSPYVADERQCEALYDNLAMTFEHCMQRLGMESRTLTAFAREYLASSAGSVPARPGPIN